MRVVKLCKRPQRYWKAFYADRPGLDAADAASQRAALCADFFGPVDSWESSLRNLGVDAHDIFAGIAPMDAAWWREYGAGAQPAPLGVASERIGRLAPDVIIIEGLEGFTPAEVATLRAASPTIRLVAGITGIELMHNRVLGAVDLVLSCMKGQVAALCERGQQAVVLPHAFDPRILGRLGPRRAPQDAINFVGNVVSGSHMHDERRRALEALVTTVGLAVYTDVQALNSSDFKRQAKLQAAYWSAHGAKRLGVSSAAIDRIGALCYATTWTSPPAWGASRIIAGAAKPSAFGLGMYRLLRRAQATFNLHVAFAGAYAANMRLFEATGAGVCLLTDHKSDIGEYFEPDAEILTYRSLEEAVEKARWIADHPADAGAIAARGQARTLKDHTFAQRMPIVVQAVGDMLR